MSAFNLGQGVSIKDSNPRVSEEEAKAKADAIAKIFSKGKWGPKPVIQGQYIKYPNTARKEAKQVVVFNLMDKQQVDAYNEFLSKTYPPECPEIILVDQDKHFSDSQNVVTHIVTYYPISYLQLDTKGFQILANPN